MTTATYSTSLWDLYTQATATKDREERSNLMIRLAERFLEDFDSSDREVHEDLHEKKEAFEAAANEFRRRGLALSRYVMALMDEEYHAEAHQSENFGDRASMLN